MDLQPKVAQSDINESYSDPKDTLTKGWRLNFSMVGRGISTKGLIL